MNFKCNRYEFSMLLLNCETLCRIFLLFCAHFNRGGTLATVDFTVKATGTILEPQCYKSLWFLFGLFWPTTLLCRKWDGEGLWEKKRIKLGCTCLSIISKRIVQKWLLFGLFSYPSFQFWSIKVIPEENQVRYSVRNGISISIILPFSYTISFSFNPWHLLP